MSEAGERFARLESVFHEALALDESERPEYLERECAGDPELLARVRKLLDLDTRRELRPNLAPPRALAAIGPYRAVRRIGRGGMGEVWLGERDDGQFVQRVAVKVVQSSLATRDVIERFRSERQLLANLAHPNIARLLDGGETEDGVPYLVMEYIDGEPIDDYCTSRELTIDERLRLFRRVCDAVQYAHSSLVVHRDIKPSNILVTPAGDPKLLDFGIAKMLPESGDDADLTQAGHRAMTPRYASPEQIAGRAITTATDVYALGVVLYELLTSRSPYEPSTDSVAEVQRAVLDTDPDRPSTALRRRLAEAKDRPRSIERHWRRLVGDLDTIVLTALRKDVEKRYASVEQLSEDVRRHLEGLPVRARPDHWTYRAGKFVSRNRTLVGAASMVFAAVVGGFAVSYAWYRDAESARKLETTAKRDAIEEREAADRARRDAEQSREIADAARIDAERARDAADAAREDASRDAAIASAVGTFLESVLTAPDPVRSDIDIPVVRDVRVVEVLDRSIEALDTESFEFPEVRARILSILGRSYFNLGDFAKALDLFERARADLAAIARRMRGRIRDSLRCYREAYEKRAIVLGKDHPRTFISQSGYAQALMWTGQPAAALAEFDSFLPAQRRLLGEAHPNVLSNRIEMTNAMGAMGKFHDMEPILRDVLDIAYAELDADDHFRPHVRATYALCLSHIDRLDEAEEHFLRAHEELVERFGLEHRRVTHVTRGIVAFYRRTGQADKLADWEARLSSE